MSLRHWATVTVVGIAVVAVAVGALIYESPQGSAVASAEGTIWTCSMHPQIRMNGAGTCPICGMALTPVHAAPSSGAGDANHLSLSEHARRMARVETVEVVERELIKEIRTVGKVALDETLVAHIAARVDGRVDEVFANFPGTRVKQGDHLLKIYSPGLVTGQREFLVTHRGEQNSPKSGASFLMSAAARERLQRLGMTDEQLDELLRTGQAQTHVVVYSPLPGTVVEKNIRAGQYVKEGDSLYTIADLAHVWLVLEIYEHELSWLRFGQSVDVTLESQPDVKFTGTIGFIEPLLNESTRTVRVRVVIENSAGKFKPGMYAQALIKVPIMANAKPAPTGMEGKYACPMHPYVISDVEGKCSACNMPLELVPGETGQDGAQPEPMVLAVPTEAVLTTGRRQLVYVEARSGEYYLVEPALGPRAGDYFPVIGGLKSGQRVVVRGNFLLDSQFQITGKPSLLYPQGIGGDGTSHTEHVGHGDSSAGHDSTKASPPTSDGAYKH